MTVERVILCVGVILCLFGLWAIRDATKRLERSLAAWSRARRARQAAYRLFSEAINRGDPVKIAEGIDRYFDTFEDRPKP